MLDLLRERGGAHIKVFGGGGGVIVPAEIERAARLRRRRASTRPRTAQRMGLQGMIDDMLAGAATSTCPPTRRPRLDALAARRHGAPRSRAADHRAGERQADAERCASELHERGRQRCKTPVLGITGTGGAGKSSLTDELVRRFRLDQDDALQIAVIVVDPSRRKTGGALLGDRIRMNAIDGSRTSTCARSRRATPAPRSRRRCRT